jgi:hypothetical protein
MHLFPKDFWKMIKLEDFPLSKIVNLEGRAKAYWLVKIDQPQGFTSKQSFATKQYDMC